MTQQINLFNPAFRKQTKPLSAVMLAQGWAAVLLGIAAFGAFTHMQVGAAKTESDQAATEMAAAQAQLAKVNAEFKPREKSAKLEADILAAETELNGQREVFSIVNRGELGNTQGYSDYFRAFAKQILPNIWITGLSIQGAGSEIEIKGRALQPEVLPAYINRLKEEPVMKGKKFARLDMSVPSVAVEEKDAKGAVVTKQQAAGYIEFVMHTNLAPKEEPGAAPAAEPKFSLLPSAPGAPK